MSFRVLLFLFSLSFASLWSPLLHAQSPNDPLLSGMMRFADVSASQVVFVYGEDLWLVPRSGGVATPLASPPGEELMPRFSPDGKTIAFVANYDGNQDIYTIPITGGAAKRLTYHPAEELLCDWTSDGRLLYSSDAHAGLPRQDQLYVQGLDEPLPSLLPIPYGTNGALDASGKRLAYTPHSHDFRTWKRYRGGMASDIWLFHLENKTATQLTTFEGTDSLPMWHGDILYYLSDAGNEHRLNLWSLHTLTGERKQVTQFQTNDCKWPSIGPGEKGLGEIVFQNGAELYLLELATSKAEPIRVQIPGDRPKLRPRQIDAAEWIHRTHPSPSLKRIAIEARGDIWTIPAKHGSPRNLTRTSGVAERDPAWSPDGQWIAYLSDASGEYELMMQKADGTEPAQRLTHDGTHFRLSPSWSPDSKHLYFTDKAGGLFLYSLDTKQTVALDRDPTAAPISVNWSPNSEWVVYSKAEDNRGSQGAIWVYNVRNASKLKLTSGFFHDHSPTFDHRGDHIFFVSARAVQSPLYEDLGNSFVYAGTEILMAMPLRSDVKHLLPPKSDEEPSPNKATGKAKSGSSNEANQSQDKTESDSEEDESDDSDESDSESEAKSDSDADDEEADEDDDADADTEEAESGDMDAAEAASHTKEDTKKNKDKKIRDPLVIESEGIERSVYPLPMGRGRYGSLEVNHSGVLLYGRAGIDGDQSDEDGETTAGNKGAIYCWDATKKEPEEKIVVSGHSDFQISADRKKLLIGSGREMWVVSAEAEQELDEPVPTTGMRVSIDSQQEWKQVLNDAWRIQRDYFYDPNMHGVDWAAIRRHYEAMLPQCVSRRDVSFLIREMISELNVGHAYYSDGDLDQPKTLAIGSLGCRFELANGAFRIAEIYRGAAWDSDARNPLDQAKVQVGQYLLAINHEPLDVTRSPYSYLQDRAGATVLLTLSTDPQLDNEDKHVPIRLLESDQNLRFRGWIERNREKVDQATQGKVGYIYVTDTGVRGQNDLVRQFFGQRHKEALIIDDRWNGGGQIPTRFIELLNRPATNFWAVRDGRDWVWPTDSHQGPKCMLINGMAGSGGDMFPALFKQMKLGPLIGTRTWGGLVGISGNPTMIDGSSVTAPTFAYYELDGTWGIEGHGVDPDVRIMDDPAKMMNHGDPQLDAAIGQMLEAIKSKGFQQPKRPQYPNRSGFGIAPQDR